MSLTQPSCDLSSAAADSATRPTPRLWFVTEIQQMMWVTALFVDILSQITLSVMSLNYQWKTAVLEHCKFILKYLKQFLGIQTQAHSKPVPVLY